MAILASPTIRRTKKGKWCADCSDPIPAGALYRLWSPHRWTHLNDCADLLERGARLLREGVQRD